MTYECYQDTDITAECDHSSHKAPRGEAGFKHSSTKDSDTLLFRGAWVQLIKMQCMFGHWNPTLNQQILVSIGLYFEFLDNCSHNQLQNRRVCAVPMKSSEAFLDKWLSRPQPSSPMYFKLLLLCYHWWCHNGDIIFTAAGIRSGVSKCPKLKWISMDPNICSISSNQSQSNQYVIVTTGAKGVIWVGGREWELWPSQLTGAMFSSKWNQAGKWVAYKICVGAGVENCLCLWRILKNYVNLNVILALLCFPPLLTVCSLIKINWHNSLSWCSLFVRACLGWFCTGSNYPWVYLRPHWILSGLPLIASLCFENEFMLATFASTWAGQCLLTG